MRYWDPVDYAIAVVFLLIALCVVLTGKLIYEHFTAETFELRKDNWECTDSAVRTRVIMVGKVATTQIYTECQQWTRK